MNPRGSADESDHGRAATPRILQFGSFELRADTGELRKHGIRVRLQTKPLHVLLALLQHPGEVVTREQLQSRLWPADTFVDFESSLNTAANRLRIALGDSADQPRYVETLPRVGYRFIAPVQETVATPVFSMINSADEAAPAIVEPAPAQAEPAPAAPTSPAIFQLPSTSGPAVHNFRNAVLVVVAAAIVAGAIFVSIRKPQHAAPTLHQITYRRGTVTSARFRPDGESVLYTANWGATSRKLYTTDLLSPESRELGFNGECLAAVSPHGELALLSNDPLSGAAMLLRVH